MYLVLSCAVAGARDRIVQALQLAHQLGKDGCWSRDQRNKIDSSLSTIRARGGVA